MRILVHDFGGYAFITELSRELARDHEVVHAYCSGLANGQGSMEVGDDDPSSLSFHPIDIGTFEKYAMVGRARSEITYGRAAAALVQSFRPDVVLSANCPLVAQALIWRSARSVGARRIYWLQDLLGTGTRAVLQERSPVLGATIGRSWELLEKQLLRRSEVIVAISEEFCRRLTLMGIDREMVVVPNWPAMREIRPQPKRNPWSKENGFADRPVALYSGTLGHKHNPEHLVAAAAGLRGTDAAVVVITEGRGRTYLEERRTELGLENLYLFDFVPPEMLSDVLAAADVLLVLLEGKAGDFSVPSKILSYLAAGRPIVGAMPGDNLASRTILAAGAGVVTDSEDRPAFVEAVTLLLEDDSRRLGYGESARAYAESAFDIAAIAAHFEGVLSPSTGRDRTVDRNG